ncbi:unnamed protein product [Chondrus crispus]|uniref:Guanylyl cyclase n=1 Tax=Chondrus crispus TaxID=2769 RepID=R7QTG6_CHOCR|nr:unnamed protein product [Chondrus crispus]CDF40806.1 unnamed protein product [Chondrus crispus]|eukprot:XP_005711100.1 unnamed protein product [Chondrus crispus]
MFRSHTKRPALPTSSTKSSYSAIARHTDDAMKDFIHTHQGTVPHVPQSYSWDCGLACVEMALRARGAKQVSVFFMSRSRIATS